MHFVQFEKKKKKGICADDLKLTVQNYSIDWMNLKDFVMTFGWWDLSLMLWHKWAAHARLYLWRYETAQSVEMLAPYDKTPF